MNGIALGRFLVAAGVVCALAGCLFKPQQVWARTGLVINVAPGSKAGLSRTPAGDAASGAQAVVRAAARAVRDGRAFVASLEQALEVVAAVRRRQQREPIQVRLAPGVFRLEQPLQLNARHARTGWGRLTIQGAADGRTVLTGLAPLQMRFWRQLPAGMRRRLRSLVPRADHARLQVAELNGARRPAVSLAQHRFHPTAAAPLALAVFDGQGPLVPARWPNAGWQHAGHRTAGTMIALPAVPKLAAGQLSDAWAAGYFGENWSYETYPLAGLQQNGVQLDRSPRYGAKAGARIRLMHHPALLDQPGEWVYLRGQKALVVWPRSPSPITAIARPAHLLRINRAANFTLSDLTLTGARGHGVELVGTAQALLSGLLLSDVGGAGIIIDRSVNIEIRNTFITRTGEQGIVLGGGDRARLLSGGLTVRDSLIWNFAALGRTYKPGVALSGVGNGVVGGLICNSAHQGIAIAGNEHTIAGTVLSGLVSETSDSGAIYAGRDWTGRGNVIRDSVLEDIVGSPDTAGGRFEVKGVYLDDMWSGTRIENNLFVNVEQPVFIGGGRDNVVTGNRFIALGDGAPPAQNGREQPAAIWLDARGLTWAAKSVSNGQSPLWNRLRRVPINAPVWRARYPELTTLPVRAPAAPLGNRAWGNIFAGMTPYYATPAAAPYVDRMVGAGQRSAPAHRGPTATAQRLAVFAARFAGHAWLGPALARASQCSDIALPVAGAK